MMTLTESLELLNPAATLVQILAGLGVVTVLVAMIRRYGERRRWLNFKLLLIDWVERIGASGTADLSDLDEDAWKVECEQLLWAKHTRKTTN